MLLSTPGLVLHTTPFGDTSVVARIFTRALGARSYIIKGVRSGKGRGKMNLLQPLSYLDLVVYDTPRVSLNHIREMRPAHPLPSLAASPVCTAVRFFMDELLYKTLREEEPNLALFDLTVDTLLQMDANGAADPSLPVLFMLDTARLAGIAPRDNFGPAAPLFSLSEGCFLGVRHEDSLSPDLSLLLHRYLCSPPPSAPLAQRQALINALLLYFQLHLSGFHSFLSHEILHSVLQ